MKNENALYTISMLSALLERGNDNYLNLLTPFILHSLPQEIGATISIDAVTEEMRNFGFKDFPHRTTEKILNQLCRIKTGIPPVRLHISDKKKNYIVSQLSDNSDFDCSKREMRKKIDAILASLQKYLETHYLYKTVEISELKEKLSRFFEGNGFTVLENVNDLELLHKEHGNESFEIGQFILDEYSKHSLIYDDLCEVTKGFLTYKAIYYFNENYKGSLNSKFQNVTFYLDCSLVLDALGYDTPEDEKAIKELVRLIRRNGGEVKVFTHTTDEVAKLIEAFAYQSHNRNSFRLDGLAAKNWSVNLILQAAQQIPEMLKKGLKIETEDAPSFSDQSNYQNILGEKEIISWLQENRPKHNSNTSDEERYQFDASSLIAVGMLRRGQHPHFIEHAKAVLITQDGWLSRCMYELYGETLGSEVPYTISDTEIVSLLWVRDYKGSANLPSEILIANAHAACKITPEVMNRAIEIANSMADNDLLPLDAALLVGSHLEFKDFLANSTHNDVANLDEEKIRVTVDAFISNQANEKVLQARQTEEARSAQIIRAEREQHNAETARLKKALDLKNNELLHKDKEIQQLQDSRQKEADARKTKIISKAKERATSFSKRVFIGLQILLWIITISLVVIFSVHCYTEYITGGSWLPYLIIDCLSFIGLPPLLLSHKSPCFKLILKIKDFVYAKQYSKWLDLE